MAEQQKKRKRRTRIVHTVYGQTLMSANSLGLAYPVLEHTTLNEKFDVQSQATLTPGEIPRIEYYVIGDGAHDFVRSEKGLTKPDIYEHRTEDAALFNHLPFVLRTLNNDLTENERRKYALRVKRQINGVDYIAYYAKRLDLSNTELRILRQEVSDGVTSTQPFIPTSQNLNPSRPELPPRGITVASNVKLQNNAEVSLVFTEEDAEELMNVARILYDDEEYAIVSEIGLCSGVDRNVSVSSTSGVPVSYAEAIACQIVTHVSTFHMVSESDLGFRVDFEIGSRTPLIAERSLDTTAYYTANGIVGAQP